MVKNHALIALLPLFFALTGCGLEAAGTAATVGTLQAQQAEQAKQQKAQLEVNLGKAMESANARDTAVRGASSGIDPVESEK